MPGRTREAVLAAEVATEEVATEVVAEVATDNKPRANNSSLDRTKVVAEVATEEVAEVVVDGDSEACA